MSRGRTILDDLDLMQGKTYNIYEGILDDRHVRDANYYFDYSDALLLFALFKQGVEYSSTTYGEESLATGGLHL